MNLLKSCLLPALAALALAPAAHASAVFDVAHPAASARLLPQQVQLGAAQRAADGVMQAPAVFQPGPHPTLVLAPAQGSWDWSGQGELRLRVQNGMGWALTVEVDVADTAGGRLHAEIGLPPGPPQILVLPLHEASPRALGMQAGPPMPWDDGGKPTFLATRVDGRIDARRIASVSLSMPGPAAPQTLLLGALDTTPGDTALHAAYAGIVDAYGQYTRNLWPEKVGSDEALRQARARETSSLHGWLAGRKNVDRYGGRLDVQGFKASGWFRTEQRGGRWWLVTPEGHAFFSLGVNAVVADGARSYVQGREWMFTGLPPASGAWAAFYGSGDSRDPHAGSRSGIGYNHGRWFDFYAANLYRADGRDWQAAWRRRTLDRLQAWGFNTIGNWSDAALWQAHRVAYTVPVIISGDFASVSSGFDYWGGMPDPFDPRFAQAADAAAARATRGVRDDPWLLGYFADNELAWAGVGPQGRWGLAMGALKGSPQSPARRAFAAQLRGKYGEPAKLAAAWGIALPSWQALDAEGFVPPTPDEAHPAVADDYSAFLRRYADAYFRIVAEALKRHDPHHLLLGGRFAVHTPEAVAACAQYCDVVSFNTYTDVPEHGFDAEALRKLGKPALITEFHFGSDDRGPFGKGVASVYTEAQRGGAYAKFVAAAAADPAIVGAHWFQYTDQPVTGRLLDGENAHIGLVGITDLPFEGFVGEVRAANLKTLQ